MRELLLFTAAILLITALIPLFKIVETVRANAVLNDEVYFVLWLIFNAWLAFGILSYTLL